MSKEISNHIHIIGTDTAVAEFENRFCQDISVILFAWEPLAAMTEFKRRCDAGLIGEDGADAGAKFGPRLQRVGRESGGEYAEEIAAVPGADTCGEYSSDSTTDNTIHQALADASRACPDVTVFHTWTVWDDDDETVLGQGEQHFKAGEKQLVFDDHDGDDGE